MAADKFGGVEKEKRKEGENVHLKTHAPQGAWVKIHLEERKNENMSEVLGFLKTFP